MTVNVPASRSFIHYFYNRSIYIQYLELLLIAPWNIQKCKYVYWSTTWNNM